jgi:hypothetical protein
MSSVLATDSGKKEASGPIHNPFGDYYAKGEHDSGQIVLRSRKGDRSMEVELPKSNESFSDFSMPMSAGMREAGRGPASIAGSGAEAPDETYRQRKPSIADREITGTFSQNQTANDERRQDVEKGLGLVPADDPTPQAESSYLSSMDRIKQLYKGGRYEAALMESDDIVKLYPTDPKVYEMRGTLFDRMGRGDLAVKSWNQALRLNPANQTLRKFIERKQQRAIASPASAPIAAPVLAPAIVPAEGGQP